MKKLFYLTSSLLIIACGGSKESSNTKKTKTFEGIGHPADFAKSITQEELKEMLYTYASDEFEGRNTGEEGQKKAVNYIKDYYVNLGIPAAKGSENYFQTVPLIHESVPYGSIQIGREKYEIGEDFVMFQGPKKLDTEISNLVYVGYGIDTENYSDYNNQEVKGKIVLVKSGEPVNKDGSYVISGTKEPGIWSNFRKEISAKVEIAKEKGAVGFIYYNEGIYKDLQRAFKRMKNRNDELKLKSSDDHFVSLYINKKIATSLLNSIENAPAFTPVEKTIRINIASDSQNINSENVVAYIKGSEKPDEYIVISAHLDHIGMDKSGLVYNGADDDGSGTVAVMEIAEAFKQAALQGEGPKRSIVFLHVTGEEKGLLGSEYYSENPIFPMEQTVADLNIDMIGRTDPKRKGSRNYVYVIGSDKLSTELREISEAMNKEYTKMELDYKYDDPDDPNRFYYRSDHYNFAKHNVPIIFYFNGTHEDYHQASDTPDKIQYDLLSERAKLVFHTAWQLANQEKRIVADKAETQE
ncbi:PA domain-containing protein [Pustulibacterium marinum]|uniref:PA domain-containing protein n=1 Tax=Pustulibacterium marinum TaxID=1224947 RepID=A0A1I7H819_9FLAO|nr:M28 family peptidase [Pustulibacterium marinum]SFU56626.1 PA domain-containing protein [Pustulibacterium marinum]